MFVDAETGLRSERESTFGSMASPVIYLGEKLETLLYALFCYISWSAGPAFNELIEPQFVDWVCGVRLSNRGNSLFPKKLAKAILSSKSVAWVSGMVKIFLKEQLSRGTSNFKSSVITCAR